MLPLLQEVECFEVGGGRAGSRSDSAGYNLDPGN